MKKYALWIAEKSATGLIVGVAMAVGVISVAYAASGNGLFADVLNKIVSNGNYQTTDGTVLQATKVLGGTATDLYTSNGTTGEWTGATNVKVGDSDKVDGLHASELAGGLSAAGAGAKPFVINIANTATCPTGWSQWDAASNGGYQHSAIGPDGGYVVDLDWWGATSPDPTAVRLFRSAPGMSKRYCVYFY